MSELSKLAEILRGRQDLSSLTAEKLQRPEVVNAIREKLENLDADFHRVSPGEFHYVVKIDTSVYKGYVDIVIVKPSRSNFALALPVDLNSETNTYTIRSKNVDNEGILFTSLPDRVVLDLYTVGKEAKKEDLEH